MKISPPSSSGFQPHHRPGVGVGHRRRGQGHVVPRHAGVVAGNQVPPPVRATTNRVRVVLAAGLDLQKGVRWPIRSIVPIPIPIQDQSGVTGTQQVGPVKEESLGTGLRTIRILLEAVRSSVAVLVQQDADVARPGNGNPALGIDRHRENVVTQVVVGIQFRTEAPGELQLRCLGQRPLPDRTADEHGQEEESAHDPGGAGHVRFQLWAVCLRCRAVS